jgi:hypothetical protein
MNKPYDHQNNEN